MRWGFDIFASSIISSVKEFKVKSTDYPEFVFVMTYFYIFEIKYMFETIRFG